MMLIILFVVIFIILIYYVIHSSLKKDFVNTPKIYSSDQHSSNRVYPSGEYSPMNVQHNPENIDKKYIPRNPILEYQYKYTKGRHPAVFDDPIIPTIYAGPLPNKAYAYNEGPYPGKPLNIPVPQGSLKLSSERWKYPFYYQTRPLEPFDYFKPYGPNQKEMNISLGGGYADDPYYTIPSFGGEGLPHNNPYTNNGSIPFIGSVNAFAPFAEVNTPWEKSGILTRIINPSERGRDEEIVNLYLQPIAPVNNIFKYMIQDKDGFMIPLNKDYLEDGDIIDYITGKGGPWKVHIYINNKYIWV